MTDEKRKEKKNFVDHRANTIVNRIIISSSSFFFISSREFFSHQGMYSSKKRKTEVHAVSYK